MEANNDKLYLQALKLWGIEAQLDMCIEEMSELIVKIMHLKRDRIKPEVLSEEIADIEIMLEQIKLCFNLESKVKSDKEFKLKRLEERLKRL